MHCLSEIIRDDVMDENIQRVSKGCRKQVRYLLLSEVQVENKELDASNVYHICKYAKLNTIVDAQSSLTRILICIQFYRDFIDQYCGEVKPGGGRLLECLRKNRMLIKKHGTESSSQCAKTLFKVEQESSFDSSIDVVVAQTCRNEIHYFCSNNPENLLICLKLNMHKEVTKLGFKLVEVSR